MKAMTALRLGRVSNLPTVLTNVASGALLAGAQPSLPTYLGLCVAMALAYVGGMFLNDAFDRRFDAAHRPTRPIPSGEAGAREVFAWGGGMLVASIALCGWVAAAQSPGLVVPALVSSSLLAATIVFYDAYHKQNPLSPLVMGACRVLVYATAAAATVGTSSDVSLLAGAGCLLSYLIGLTYAAKQESFGRLPSAWPLSFLFLPFATLAWVPWPWGYVAFFAFALATLHALSFLVLASRRNIPKAVSCFLAGICFLDAVLVSIAGHPELGLLCLAGYPLTRILQRYVAGT